MDAANAFLPDFIKRYTAKYAKTPFHADTLHRAVNDQPDRLHDVFCYRYAPQRIILAETVITRALPDKYVDTFAFSDGGFGLDGRAR